MGASPEGPEGSRTFVETSGHLLSRTFVETTKVSAVRQVDNNG